MTRPRASFGLRDSRLRRSKAQVAAILESLESRPPPLSEAEQMEIRARLSEVPAAPQLPLCLPKNEAGQS